MAAFVKKIVDRRRRPVPRPHYSDYHFLPDYKIEILPGDQIAEKTDVRTHGDRLIVVARPVGDPSVSKRAARDAIAELEGHKGVDVVEGLSATISALNRSYLVYMGSPKAAPKGGAMILMVYLQGNTMTFAQVGPITLKHKVGRYYETITQNHTFDNPDEWSAMDNTAVPRFSYNLAKSLGMKPEQFVGPDEIDHVVYPHTPSRFIGHPEYCLADESASSPAHISAQPYSETRPI